MNSITPNLFAMVAIIVWPLIAAILYSRKSLASATVWTVLAAQLLLPVGTFFKFAMIPQFDKNSVPSLCALVGCMVAAKRPLRLWRSFGFAEFLICAYLVSPVITSTLNGDPIIIGGTVLPGVGVYDGLSALLGQFIVLIPFFLGREFLRGADNTQLTLSTLAFAGLAYSLPLLFEIRFSPQLHGWLYGYYPTDFAQEMRDDGGFRPMVFMGHGLIACFFEMTTLVASAALWRAKIRVIRLNMAGPTAYLGVVLVLCKSGAALVYGLVLTPLVRWASPTLQMRVAVLLTLLALLYPMLRMTETFPTTTLFEIAQSYNADRAQSLGFRFDQEQKLLAHASQRLMFGWGRFGRNRVYNEDWQGIGVDTSVTDGRWIVTFGQFGIVGFIAEFGLLAIAVFKAVKALKAAASFREALFSSALALIIAINMIDLLPNSALSPWTWLLVGSLLGCSEKILARDRQNRFRSGEQAQFGCATDRVSPAMKSIKIKPAV